MSNDEQDRASGSVPNAFGNALAWKWSREMPTPLRRGFLTLLYALRAMANASGELRFTGDRQPIRIQDIARAAGASEKDARRYLDAAIRSGAVVVKGERKRGRPTLYVIVPTPWPDWKAAEDYLKSTARKPGKRPAPWSPEPGSSGDRDPNQNGSPRPVWVRVTATRTVRVTATRTTQGLPKSFPKTGLRSVLNLSHKGPPSHKITTPTKTTTPPTTHRAGSPAPAATTRCCRATAAPPTPTASP